MTAGTPVRTTVRSKDGTLLDVWRSGRGPPLVLVHGTTADHTRWEKVRPALDARFTLHAMDRRDRRSEGRPYAFEREVEDVLAVLDAAGGAPVLLGHSFGAMCALEAAALRRDLRALVLYEGGFTSSDRPEWEPALDGIARRIASGDREAALELFMRDIVQLKDHELDAVRRASTWEARRAAVHTIEREVRVSMRYRFDPVLAARVQVPTLLLVGGASPPAEREDAARVAAAIPEALVRELPEQGHAAMDTAPQLFCDEVLRFLA